MNASILSQQSAVLLPNRYPGQTSQSLCTTTLHKHAQWYSRTDLGRGRSKQHSEHGRATVVHKLQQQQRLQGAVGSQAAVASADDSIESVIADVLNANRAKIQRPADLLAVLDSTGNGLQTTVNRSWDTTAVTLSLTGTWAGASEARKMAMLAVYQERHVRRAALLLQLFRCLTKSQPGLLDSDAVTQLEAAAAANQLNPAAESLLVPQLMQMAAGVYPWGVLQRVVEGAVQAASDSLFRKPPYTYSTSKRQAAQQQLLFVEASLARGAAYVRLRALLPLLQQQQQQQQQQAGDGARILTPEQAYYESWQQQQQQQDLKTADGNPSASAAAPAAAAAGLQGKCTYASFHQRSSNPPYALQHTPGHTAAASSSMAAAAVDGDQGCEIHLVCNVINKLTEQARQLQQNLPGGRESTLGVLPEVQQCQRSALLDLCVLWAESSPAIVMDTLPDAAVAKVAVSSIEHDRLLRRIGLECSGPEVSILRQLAKSKGRSFLAHFSPTVGNPFGDITEWDYFRECPGVWNRFVIDPPTETATLLLKPGSSWQQQQQQSSGSGPTAAAAAAARGVKVKLSQSELQQLIQQLVAVLSNSSSSGSSRATSSSTTGSSPAAAAAANGVPGYRQITLQPAASSSSSSSTTAGSDQAGPRLLLLIDGVAAAELSPAHVTSLVTVIDDLVVQLPGQYSSALPHVQVAHAKPLQQFMAAAAAWISSSSKAVAAAALLALPLLAIGRPFRGLQHVTPTSAAAAAVVTDSSAASSSSSWADRQQQRRLQPINDYVIDAEMQQLCEIVQQQVQGKVWLPDLSSSSTGSGKKGWQIPGFQTSRPAAAAGKPAAATAEDDLIYQVIVDREGHVSGCRPCSSAAAAAYLELPLAATIQGPSLAKVQAKRLESITTAAADSPKPAKKAPKPSSSRVGQLAAAYTPIPKDGVVVLKLVLKTVRQPPPAAAAAVGQVISNPQQQQQQQQQQGSSDQAVSGSDQGSDLRSSPRPGSGVVSKLVGTGKSAVNFILMQPEVSPWCDADSLRSWADSGSVLYQGATTKGVTDSIDARSAGQASSASGTQLGGLALTVDGQKIGSIEELVKQLLDKNSAAEAAVADADVPTKGQPAR